MFSDFSFILYWWLIIFTVGVIFTPLTRILFGKFWDKGYPFGKILGILFISYTVWLLGSLKILPFANGTIWLVILLAAGINLWLFRQKPEEVKKEIQNSWRIFAFEEFLFFIALTFWSFVRGFQPNIQGLEKFMDYGFVNSILRSKYFPPTDMWLAGKAINYYYFGHLISAVLTKFSGIDSAITYNLLIASLFAFAFTGSFSIGGNLIFSLNSKAANRKLIIISGLITAFLVSLGGNLHPLWWFLKHGNFKGYWYPDATRFIVEKFGASDNTIHEFPAYSFVVADLHGHLLNLPNVLLFLALILVIFTSKKNSAFLYFFVSMLLAVFYMTNAWDFAIYNLLFGCLVLVSNYLKSKLSFKTIVRTAKIVFPVFIGSIILALPFHLNFKSLVGGVALADFHSPLWMLLVLWGFPLFICLSYLLFVKLTSCKLQIIDYFVFILWGVAWFLIIFPEFFYIKDIYVHSYQRANTMFKLTYQSFVIFYLIAPWVFLKILISLKRRVFKLLFLLPYLLIAVFVIFCYPNFAIKSYYGLKTYKGLYGLGFLKNLYPDDYQAVLWLRKNISTQPVIVEAVGESYTDFARVSALTGLPTVLGWRVHEWLWRGSFDEPGKRTEEVREIYESADLEKTKMLLNKYNVEYIFVGTLERQQYPNLSEEKFTKLGEIVFVSGKTKIYKVSSQ